MMKNYPLRICCILIMVLFMSCGGHSADEYADRFCGCSVELAKAHIQLNNKLISPETFRAIEAEQEICMGEDDPLKALEDSPEEQELFQMEFVQALEKKCPAIARDMGF